MGCDYFYCCCLFALAQFSFLLLLSVRFSKPLRGLNEKFKTVLQPDAIALHCERWLLNSEVWLVQQSRQETKLLHQEGM